MVVGIGIFEVDIFCFLFILVVVDDDFKQSLCFLVFFCFVICYCFGVYMVYIIVCMYFFKFVFIGSQVYIDDCE